MNTAVVVKDIILDSFYNGRAVIFYMRQIVPCLWEHCHITTLGMPSWPPRALPPHHCKGKSDKFTKMRPDARSGVGIFPSHEGELLPSLLNNVFTNLNFFPHC